MRRNVVKLRFGDDVLVARKAIALQGSEDSANGCACPLCKQSARKKRPLGDVLQYGFEWDWHRTVFQCKCGCIFYHDYRLWHLQQGE